jgi:benzoyl-CoA oxygenase/reductase BoxA protein
MSASLTVLKQHLIDPEVCIRCNTCEETCPVHAITHDSANYVVNADVCNSCMACIAPCPTGSIDNWRTVLKAEAYSVADQYTWTELPKQAALPEGAGAGEDTVAGASAASPVSSDAPPLGGDGRPTAEGVEVDLVRGSRVPPWSAAHPYVNLYAQSAPLRATVAGNYRLTAETSASDIRHIVLDFGQTPFPVLEGQSIAILPPGATPEGRKHHARQYSVASPRNGERPGYNNLSLTVKRVVADVDGGRGAIAKDGVCSNYLCDLKKGDTVDVIGPFGATFLMPNHPGSNILMICTGTGSAPMRAMTEYRRRKRDAGATGRLVLFFGARTKEELPYFGPLMSLPQDFIDVNLAFSRTPGQPKRYVQDALRERAPLVASLLRDEATYIYVCGLKGMEDGVVQALEDIATGAGLAWAGLAKQLRDTGRLHFETY